MDENTQTPVQGGNDEQGQNAGTPTEGGADQDVETTAGDNNTTGEAKEAPEEEESKQTW